MAEIGWASLGVVPTFDGFERKLDQGTSKAMLASGAAGGSKFGDAAGKSAGSRFGSVFKTAAKASLVGVAALGVGAFKLAKDSIGAASDLEESTNKVQQVFGKGADSVFRFSEKAADALGQTNQQARDAAATFGLFGNIAGLSDRKSAKFATRMTKLASDLASFHNTEPGEAVEALGAALRGEAEPIRSFGVLLDEATLKAEALRIGLLEPVKDQAKIKGYQVDLLQAQKELNEVTAEFGPKSIETLEAQADLGLAQDRLKKATEGTIPQLTQQQKVLAAQSSIFKQTKVAQGDFARTSDGLANQQRRLSARFEDAKAKLGKGLLPIMTDAADFLLDKGIPAFEKFSGWFTKDGIPAIKEFAGFAKDAAGEVKDLVDRFNDMPEWVKKGALGGALGLGVAAKLRGGKSGVLGTAGSALGMTKPVPVVVTNWAKIAGGGGDSVIAGGDGDDKKNRKRPRRRMTAGKGGAFALVASILGEDAAREVAAEVNFGKREWDRLVHTDSKAKVPQDDKRNRRGGDGLSDLLLGPLGKNTHVKAPGGLGDILDKPLGKFGERVAKERDKLAAFTADVELANKAKIHPDIKIPRLPREHEALQSFYELGRNASNQRINPEVSVRGLRQAQREVQNFVDTLSNLPGWGGIGGGGINVRTDDGSRVRRHRRQAALGGFGGVY